MNHRISFLSLSLLGCLAFSAWAQTLKDGPFLAIPQGSEVETSSVGYGWGVGYEFSNYASIDVSISRQEDELKGDTIESPGFPADSQIDLQIVHLSTGMHICPLATAREYALGLVLLCRKP